MNEEFALKIMPLVKGLRLYHRHQVFGIKNIPDKGGVIVATNHSLATYDISLLMAAVYDLNKRFPRSLIDHTFYKLPMLGNLMEACGCVAGTPENGEALLNNGQILYIAPGGMRESLRPSNQKYKIFWERRKGFVRLSIKTGSPIVLAACPAADDIYDVYDNPLTKLIYQHLKMPFFIAKGLGISALPKPVRLQHLVSEPLYPPKMLDDAQAFKRQVNRFHKKVTTRMEALMEEAVRAMKTGLIATNSTGKF